MGIIKKQGIQGSLFLYAGVFIGFLTSSVFFPRLLSKEQLGLIYTLVSYSMMFAQFSTLGFNSVIIRMFPYFRDNRNKHNHFFSLVLLVIVAGGTFSVIAYYLLKSLIIEQNIENASLFVKYTNYLIPLILFTLIFYLLDTYYTVLFKAVRGIMLKELVQRILVLVALYFFYKSIFSFRHFVIGYIIALSIPAIILFICLLFDGELVIKPKLSFITKDLRRSMLSVGFFGILASLVGTANVQIDKAMASSMLGLEATGIYSTVFVFAALIKVPSRALLKIASAIIAEAWKRNDITEIKKVYIETSLNQYIIGLLVFIGLWANIDNIFRILPDGFEAGKYVILLLGLAYTFEMATGASSQIIASSKHYKYLTWFVAIMLVLVVVTNLIFVPIFKITGIAIATSLTVFVFTLLKVVFIYRRFKTQPFNIKFLYVSGIGALAYLVSIYIPVFEHLVLDILVRSVLIAIVYILLLALTKVSPDLNAKLSNFIK